MVCMECQSCLEQLDDPTTSIVFGGMHVCFDKYRTDNGGEDHELQELDDIPQNIEEVSATARNKFALLIGNNNYDKINSLSGCIKDVHNFKTYLNDHGGFKTENIDTQQNLTYKKILEKMDLFASGGKNHDVGEGDLVVLYYAGHGSRRRTDDGSSPIPFAEDTICPIDTYHAGDGSNRDISRNMIQAWVSKMKSKGAKVLLFFDSCHSGGLIRGDEEIPKGSRAIFDDTRAIADQKRPDIPEYDWLESLRGNDNGLNSIATAVGENIACLAACGRTELARETAQGGAMTFNLIEILNDNNQKGPNLTFLQIMEKIREALNKKNLSQTPDISGDTDTIAFCMHNLVKSSPFPYILTEVASEEPKKIQFLSAYMLPLITEGSRFHLFDTSDSEMTNILMTIEVDSVSNCSNNATAIVSDVSSQEDSSSSRSCSNSDGVLKKGKFFRAVEILHIVGKKDHYTKVRIDGTSDTLIKLQNVLCDMKREIFKSRNKFPVKDLPPSCFAMIADVNETAADAIIVQSSEDNIISITDKLGNLVLPKVKLKSSCEKEAEGLNLVASYISSYSHWNMIHNLSSSSPLLSNMKCCNFTIKGEEGQEIKLNNEGYYELNFSNNRPEKFEICAEISCTGTEDIAIMVAELDVDYGVYYYEDFFEKVSFKEKTSPPISSPIVITRGKYISAKIPDIVTDDSSDKWCVPFLEWKVFVSTVRHHKSESSLDQGMKLVQSKGIKKLDYQKNEPLEDEEDMRQAEIVDRTTTNSAEEWTCFSFKFTFSELNKYSQSKHPAKEKRNIEGSCSNAKPRSIFSLLVVLVVLLLAIFMAWLN